MAVPRGRQGEDRERPGFVKISSDSWPQRFDPECLSFSAQPPRPCPALERKGQEHLGTHSGYQGNVLLQKEEENPASVGCPSHCQREEERAASGRRERRDGGQGLVGRL